METYVTVIISAIAAVTASFGLWVVIAKGHYAKKTVEADATKKIADAALAMVKSIQVQLDTAREVIDELRERIRCQDIRIVDLEHAKLELDRAHDEIKELREIVRVQGERIGELEKIIRGLDPSNPILNK